MKSTDLPAPSAADRPHEGAAAGETVGARNFQHYQVLRREDGTPWELGRGTMGITYKALDTNLRSEVALKVVNSTFINHPNARDRFVREARAAAALRHRNVASVYHLGNDGEHFFYAMEFIDGETLDALVRRQGPLPVGTALRLTLQVARALSSAARQKLVHRDIKPANVMVVHEDADEHMVVKVIDFGLARPTAEDGGESGAGSLTIHGFVGTPQYASPEQLEEKELDARSDIYSLGVTLWFLLTGKPPFAGSLAGICNQHLSKPPPWETLPASVPTPVRRLLAHMLEKDPARRPQDAVELRREIDDCLLVLDTPAPAPTAEDAPAAPGLLGPVAKLFTGLGRRRADPDPAGDAGRNDGAPLRFSGRPLGAGVQAGAVDAPATEIGTLVGDRFELLSLVGEGGSGRVFKARDLADGSRPVAVKLLRPGFGGVDEEERQRLRVEARQVSASPHPNLVRLIAFEPGADARKSGAYVVEEWLSGFNLRDLLAARNGALPAVECLRLLGQAAAAADHASSRRLERLELGIHQIHLHFPAANAVGEFPERRGLLQMSMEEWPRWALKLEPFSVRQNSGESGTWAGEVTLLPGTPLAAALRHGAQARGTDGANEIAAAEPLATAYLRALARITYELLGGHLPSGTSLAGRAAAGKYVSLPTLSEAGNAVLARALSDAPGFASASQLYEALALAAGFAADTLAPVALQSFDPFPPVPAPALPLSPPTGLPPALLAAVLATAAKPPAARRAGDSSAALTLLPRVDAAHGSGSGTSQPSPPQANAAADVGAPAAGLRGGVEAQDTDISGLADPSAPMRRRQVVSPAGQVPARGGSLDSPADSDPWRDSEIARLLEEEEARKLIDPGSTGFALAVGAMLGLVLLMAGFGVMAWRHEHQPATAAKRLTATAAASGRDAAPAGSPARQNPPGARPGPGAASGRPTPLPTPLALAPRRSAPVSTPAPAANLAAAVPVASTSGTPHSPVSPTPVAAPVPSPRPESVDAAGNLPSEPVVAASGRVPDSAAGAGSSPPAAVATISPPPLAAYTTSNPADPDKTSNLANPVSIARLDQAAASGPDAAPIASAAVTKSAASDDSLPAQPVIPAGQARLRPDPTPRFNDKVVHVKINSDPVGADVFLQGAFLGKTPLNIDLPPDSYEFVARYHDWPEIHQDLRVTDKQEAASTEIRLMSPSRVPVPGRFSPVLEYHRTRRRDRPATADGAPAPSDTTGENVPVARAKPVTPEVDPPAAPGASAGDSRPRRALPVLEPFIKRDSPNAQTGPVQPD